MLQNQNDINIDEFLEAVEKRQVKKKFVIKKNYVVSFYNQGHRFYAINNRRKPSGVNPIEERCKMILTAAEELAKWLKENSSFTDIEIKELDS